MNWWVAPNGMQPGTADFPKRARACPAVCKTVKCVLCSSLAYGHQQNELKQTMNATYQETDS